MVHGLLSWFYQMTAIAGLNYITKFQLSVYTIRIVAFSAM